MEGIQLQGLQLAAPAVGAPPFVSSVPPMPAIVMSDSIFDKPVSSEFQTMEVAEACCVCCPTLAPASQLAMSLLAAPAHLCCADRLIGRVRR